MKQHQPIKMPKAPKIVPQPRHKGRFRNNIGTPTPIPAIPTSTWPGSTLGSS